VPFLDVEKYFRAGRPQMTKWYLRIACWITKATNTFAEYVIFIAFPLQQWLHERASKLRYTYIVYLVSLTVGTNSPREFDIVF
jgi:hypothetical protein